MIRSKDHEIGLSVLRVIFGFIILKNVIFYFPDAQYFFGKNGIAPWDDFVSFCRYSRVTFILYFFDGIILLKLYLVILCLSSFAFCLGFGGVVNGIFLYFLYFFLRMRNGLILDGSDNVISVILPFLIFANSYKYFKTESRLDGLGKRIREKRLITYVNDVLCLGILVQVVIIYFFTSVAKSGGTLWQNGTAVYYTLRVEEFMATKWNIILTQNMYFVVISTYLTLITEIAFPFLIWFKQTKFIIMVATALLHIGIFIFMRIDNFSWVMIATYFAFIKNEEYLVFKAKLTSALNAISNRLKLT
jgi:hypothetical protein